MSVTRKAPNPTAMKHASDHNTSTNFSNSNRVQNMKQSSPCIFLCEIILSRMDVIRSKRVIPSWRHFTDGPPLADRDNVEPSHTQKRWQARGHEHGNSQGVPPSQPCAHGNCAACSFRNTQKNPTVQDELETAVSKHVRVARSTPLQNLMNERGSHLIGATQPLMCCNVPR